MVTQNTTETATACQKSGKNKMLTMAQIRNNGGEASFSELYRYTLIHVATGKRRFTDRRPSLSYFSPLLAWDNKRNEEVPKRSLASARAAISKAKGVK